MRARLYPNQTSNFSATYPAVAQNGFFALSGQPNFFTQPASPGAFSRLHLVDQAGNGNTPLFYAPTQAYRGWMRNGITMTGNADMGYMGQKYLANDRTDMVLHWSNDAGTMAFAPDRLRIMFTTLEDGALSGATSFEGLEAARFYPPRANEVFMGLGDFFAGNLVDPINITEPTERFDVLNGRVRIRQLPEDEETEDAYRVMVVDNTADPLERGVVKWVDPATLVPADREWSMNAASPNHVYTAVGAADPDCPDDAEAVGIGYDLSQIAPAGKLAVHSETFKIGVDVDVSMVTTEVRGVNVLATGGTDFDYGVFSEVQSNAKRSRGVYGASSGATYYGIGGLFVSGDNATYTTGAQGHVKSGQDHGFGVLGTCISKAKLNVGVRGHIYSANENGGSYFYRVQGVSDVDPLSGQLACGVRGEAVTLPGVNSWAVFSSGNQFSTTGSSWTPSDVKLKTDIQTLQNALGIVMQLQPKSYRYRHEEFPHLHLATESQYGFLAQELEEVQPQMVRDVHFPAEMDSTGAELQTAMDLKAVKLDGMVPLVIAAIKEQQVLITTQQEALDELREQVSEMQEALSAWCENRDAGALQKGAKSMLALAADADSDRKLASSPTHSASHQRCTTRWIELAACSSSPIVPMAKC